MERTAYVPDSTLKADVAKPPGAVGVSVTRLLLLCGVIAGPAFVLTVLIQDYTRPGVDPRLQPLSELSLGDWGWVQILNFVVAGVLNLAYAVGLWRALPTGRPGTWGPIFTAAYGLGLVTVGVFTTDPANGFPPGVAAPSQESVHGIVHGVGGLFTFLMLAAGFGVFVHLFLERNEPWWAAYCLVSGMIMLVAFFDGLRSPELMARMLRLATLIGWLASSVIAVKLLAVSSLHRHQQVHEDHVGTYSMAIRKPWRRPQPHPRC